MKITKKKDLIELWKQEKYKDKALIQLLYSLLGEAQEIAKIRNCQKKSAFKAIILELNDKWNAVSEDIKEIKKDYFLEYMKDTKIGMELAL